MSSAEPLLPSGGTMIPSHPPPPFLGPPPMLDETKSFSSVGNDKQSVGPHPGRPPKLLVAAIFLMFVVLRAMDRVFNKRVIDRMPNYQLMVRPFLLPPPPSPFQSMSILTPPLPSPPLTST